MTTEPTNQKNCLNCNKIIKGRTDKKFCNDYCRNGFNNQLKSSSNNLIRNINNTLGKNRRILEAVLTNQKNMVKIKREQLLHEGYQFKYQTHQYKSKTGAVCHFCYGHGYIDLDQEWCLVVNDEG